MNEQWRRQMQQAMEAYEQEAPEVSWESIEREVAANRKRTVRHLWYRRGAAAAAILLLLSVMFETVRFAQEEATHHDVALSERLSEKSSQGRTGMPGQQLQAKAEAKDHAEKTSLPAEAAESIKHVATVASPEPAETAVTSEPAEHEEQPTHAGDEEPQEPVRPAPPAKPLPSKHQPAQQAEHLLADTKRIAPQKNEARLTAKVYLNNSLVGNYLSEQTFQNRITVTKEYPQLADNEIDATHAENVDTDNATTQHGDSSTDTPSEGSTTDVPNSHTVTTTETQTVSTHESVDHHQPVRIGFSLRYRISERWGIESGLAYTHHRSDFTLTTPNELSKTEQRLNYIGIPLSVSYQLWNSRRFSIYVAAGGMVEKMVSGSSSTTNWTNGQLSSVQPSQSVSIKPLQFSIGASLGAELHFTQHLGIYAEPGLNYYFNNGSTIKTFYQDKPIGFSLNLGLRWSIK